MPLRAPEPGSFEHLLVEARVEVAALVRLSRYPATEPWWSRGACRFDGPPIGESGRFGTCYAALDISVAFAESIVHECGWFRRGCYEVPEAELVNRHIVQFARPAAPALVLANLSGQALKALGLNNDISASDDYTAPMAWARAIHGASAKWDGILYVSRQRNDGYAVALFDRSRIARTVSRKLDGPVLTRLCTEYGVIAV